MCTLWGKEQKEQMPHGLNKKRPAKKNQEKKIIWSLLLLNQFREGVHMGKIRLEKR